MKKTYETPSVEIVKFKYRDQVVAESGYCGFRWTHVGTVTCEGNEIYEEQVN